MATTEPVNVVDLWSQATPTLRMVGRKYGELTVLKVVGRRRYASQAHLAVLVRCSCGREYEVQASQVRRSGAPRCLECHGRRSAAHQRVAGSVRLSNGWTIAQVAIAYGLNLDTVYRRFLRGWPLEKLGIPLRKGGGGRGFGGSVDLPERRGLKLGRRP